MKLSERSKHEFAFVVMSCDEYSDLWEPFFDLKEKYFNLDINTYLISNTTQYKRNSILNINADFNWTKRLSESLRRIEEEYVFLILEDFYFTNKVSKSTMYKIFDEICVNHIEYYKLSTFSKIPGSNLKGKTYKRIKSSIPYGISVQPAIWRKEWLLELLGTDDVNAWKFEEKLIQYVDKVENKFIDNCFYDNRDPLNLKHMVVQGQVLPSGIKALIDIGYDVNKVSRKIMPKRTYYFYKLKLISKSILKGKIRRIIKKLFKLFGIKFVTE